jgi:flagellar biosynthesis/type III secretory pathway M-ring protein FliF/YscJ
MRYLEYIYLAWAVVIAAYIASSYKHLSALAMVGLCIAAGLMAFMYSFRRSQRLLIEKMAREQPYPEEEDEEEEEEIENDTQDQPQEDRDKEGKDGI